jgi:hypothetical protein
MENLTINSGCNNDVEIIIVYENKNQSKKLNENINDLVYYS